MKGRIMSALAAAAALAASIATPAGSFGDVDDDDWFAPAVTWLEVEGLSTGTSPGCYQPDRPISRAEVAVFLHRMAGEPAPIEPMPFVDMGIVWADDAVRWMAEIGITTGVSPTRFAPSDFVTRGQFATFLHRSEGSPAAPPHPFTDVGAAYQQAPVSWLATTGITTGTSPTSFSPDRLLTRAELAVLLHRHAGEPVVEPIDETPCVRPLVIHGVGDVNFEPGYGPYPRNPYSYAYSGLGGLFLTDDLSMINLECSPSELGSKVPKTFNFRCPPASLEASAAAGVDVANLANNHAADYGLSALLDGVANVAAAGMAPIGAGVDLDSAVTPARFEINGVTIAVLGFNSVGSGWRAGPTTGGMADADLTLVAAAIAAADEVADYVFVSVHWGTELTASPNARDVAMGHAMVDAGADAVFGHHPHVLQPMEIYNDRPIFWSLGNFVWHTLSTTHSAIGRVVIETDGSVTGSLVPVRIFETGHPVLGG